MGLRDWTRVSYIPMLSLRPAEMRALEELPNATKDRLLPITHLRPWTTALQLENSTRRIHDAYSNRPIIVAMGEAEAPTGRPVDDQLHALRSPANGFSTWCALFEEHENYVPAIQFSSSTADEEAQINQLYSYGRGLVIIIEPRIFQYAEAVARRVGERTFGGEDVCFVIDLQTIDRHFVNHAARAESLIAIIRSRAPNAVLSTSATSFPVSFSGVPSQPIYERLMFDSLPAGANAIYGDRGSTRFERQSGGNGMIPPRIDYPLRTQWRFDRLDDGPSVDGYCQQARKLVDSNVWEPQLRVWGTQMIERTAAGDTSAINSTQKATAARINLHLHRQAFYGDPEAANDTDEDWED